MKHYITEHQAIKLLTDRLGESITPEEIAWYAYLGVVPAYIKFSPKNKDLYPGKSFFFVMNTEKNHLPPDELTMHDVGSAAEWNYFPFPLPENGIVRFVEGFAHEKVMVKLTEDLAYRLLVARSDGQLEAISEQHIVRVYARQEVSQAAENVANYRAKRDYQRMVHSCGELYTAYEVVIDEEKTRGWFMSPFEEEADSANFKKRFRKGVSSSTDEQLGEYLPCMPIVIAAMRELIKELKGRSGYYTDEVMVKDLQRLLPKSAYTGMGTRTVKGALAEAKKRKKSFEPEVPLSHSASAREEL